MNKYFQILKHNFELQKSSISDEYRFVIFGAGEMGTLTLDFLTGMNLEPIAFFDNKESADTCGIPIVKPYFMDKIVVLVASVYAKEIIAQLISLGFYPGNIIHGFSSQDIKPTSFAPYSLKIYNDFLNMHLSRKNINFAILGFDDAYTHKAINIYLRHDIDHMRDLKMLPAILDIEIDCKVRSISYIKCDDENYLLTDAQSIVRKYLEKGHLFGLHSTCYMYDDFIGKFEDEIFRFKEVFLFNPLFFNMHGNGDTRYAIKCEFREFIRSRVKQYGFLLSDDFPEFFKNRLTIHDCSGGPDFNKRFLKEDFFNLPSFLKTGDRINIVTHPGYWKEDCC